MEDSMYSMDDRSPGPVAIIESRRADDVVESTTRGWRYDQINYWRPLRTAEHLTMSIVSGWFSCTA
jgi:hypothetical protein